MKATEPTTLGELYREEIHLGAMQAIAPLKALDKIGMALALLGIPAGAEIRKHVAEIRYGVLFGLKAAKLHEACRVAGTLDDEPRALSSTEHHMAEFASAPATEITVEDL